MNILLVRLRLIGDVVFTTPAVRALKRRWPEARLTYVVEPEAEPVVAHNPHLDRILVAPRAGGWRRLRDDLALARHLRAGRFDVAIDFHGGTRSAWLTWASGAPVRIGYDVSFRGWMYTHRVRRPRRLRPRHSVENQWDLLAPLGAALALAPDRRRDAVEMAVDPAAAARVAARLQAAAVSEVHRLILVHVSAGNAFRRWPEASFVDLACRLATADLRRRIILSSGPDDRATTERIGDAARRALGDGRADQILAYGEFDLAELRALVGRSALFVGGDTGPLHVAATANVPIIGIYGPTLPARSAPWRDPAIATASADVGELPCRPCDQRRCLPGDFRCLTSLSSEAVAAAAERLLEHGT